MPIRIVDIKNMPPLEKQQTIQAPLYHLFRQLYKGPLYETPDFCFQKCIDSEADIFKVAMQFESDKLVGASVLKIIPTNEIHDEKRVSILEVTSGYLPEFRGNLNITQFVMGEMIEYKRENPTRLLCLCDLMTSPVSYMLFLNHPISFYPRFDVEMPEKITLLLSKLIDRMPQYHRLQYPDAFVRQGAKPWETLYQYYVRLTYALQSNPHIQYYYSRTKGVLGWGLFVIQLIEQSAEEIESILKNYITHRGTQKKTFQFELPHLKSTDFNYLIQLHHLRDNLKNKTLSNMMPQRVTIKLSDSDQRDIQRVFQQIGFHGEIMYCQPMKNISYAQRAELLNHKSSHLIFYHDNHAIFEVTVPKGVFNPFTGPIAAKFVEMILHGDIDVKNKAIIDLGCGCGNIGLAAILMGADKVLFSDINPNFLETLKKHEFINQYEHELKVQDLLTETLKDNHHQYDMLLMSTPTFLNNSEYFFQQLIIQANKILKENGEMILWSMLTNYNEEKLNRFLNLFHGYFDLNEFTILSVESQKNISVFSESEKNENNLYILYKIKKTIPTNVLFMKPMVARAQAIAKLNSAVKCA